MAKKLEKTCPKCDTHAKGNKNVEAVFGLKKNKSGSISPKTYCKGCVKLIAREAYQKAKLKKINKTQAKADKKTVKAEKKLAKEVKEDMDVKSNIELQHAKEENTIMYRVVDNPADHIENPEAILNLSFQDIQKVEEMISIVKEKRLYGIGVALTKVN